MNSDELLRVEDLVVEYSSGKSVIHAVNGITFQLKKGETLALVGETGAGKTSIAKAILRILPDVSAKSKGTVPAVRLLMSHRLDSPMRFLLVRI